MLPLTMHSVGRVGHDLLVIAVAQGYEQVVIANPAKADETTQIGAQVTLARALMSGVGGDDEARFVVIDEADPDKVAAPVRGDRPKGLAKARAFQPDGQSACTTVR